MNRLVGLYRETEFSPGRHKSNDSRLLELVADGLRERGFGVELVPVNKAIDLAATATLVFSMCQGTSALEMLTELETRGIRVINSPRAALNTYRERLPQVMARAGLPFPQTHLVSTNGSGSDRKFSISHPMWLKRGDVHASIAADVQWITNAAQLDIALADYATRGIHNAALQEHQAGDEIKFYGVADEFFHWFYPSEASGYNFDAKHLRCVAVNAAQAAGLDIFGGDIIVSPAGRLTLIDLNDWPSFAPCLGSGAEAIADFIADSVAHG